MDWEIADKVQKNKEGKYRAQIAGEWIPVERAQKSPQGVFRVIRTLDSQSATEIAPASDQPAHTPPLSHTETDIAGDLGRDLGNVGKGFLSGTADIGDTLIDAATYIPRIFSPELNQYNKERGESLEAFNKDHADSTGFQVGRIGSNIAGTVGVGPALGKGLGAVSKTAKMKQLAEALRTGGMKVQGGNMGTRMAGGAITGAGMAGLVDPKNASMGGLIGGVLPPAVGLAYRAGKGLVSMAQPFYQKGREKILGRFLTEVSGKNPEAVMQNLETAPELVKGSLPTSAAAAKNAGISAAQRASTAVNPATTNELAERAIANNEARMALLRSVTPDKAAAQTARKLAVDDIYAQASDKVLTMTSGLKRLLKRPSMQAALKDAEKMAAESGKKFDPAALNGRSAQIIKLSLDDMIKGAGQKGIVGNELAAIKKTRDAYLRVVGRQIPEYIKANKEFAKKSIPVNQAEILENVKEIARNKVSGNLTPAAMTRATTDKAAKTATGYKGTTVEGTLSPEQLNVVGSIESDLLREVAGQTAGKGVGSNTVQNLAFGNMINSFGIPTALKNNSVTGSIGNILAQVGNLGYKRTNQILADQLAEILLNPKAAAALMRNAAKAPTGSKLGEMLMKTIPRVAPTTIAPPATQAITENL